MGEELSSPSVDLGHITEHLPVIQSFSHYSEIPSLLIDSSQTSDFNPLESVCLGVDEAGRGPVLGPMVYAYSYIPMSRKNDLKNLGVDDSKILKASERENLFKSILNNKDWIGWAFHVCSPRDISECMLRRSKFSLNDLAHETTINLIKGALNQRLTISEIYIDTVGPPLKYQEKLQGIFPGIKITVAKKADSLYPVVSAASICAKVTRDAILNQWQFCEKGVGEIINRDFGSGYPSDPNTTSWLKKNCDNIFGFPQLIRFSWSTTEKLLEKLAIPVKWPSDVEKSTQDIRIFFQKTGTSQKKRTTSTASCSVSKRLRSSNMIDQEEDGDSEDAISEEEIDGNSSRSTSVIKPRPGQVTCIPSTEKRDPIIADLKLQHVTSL
ncbi:Ribonuclease H2 subunit A [Nowakowskiella sp. JEL0078]|nr:Ribonuclease H2 subunit A [Nowakowskiella sp. JEL0078]